MRASTAYQIQPLSDGNRRWVAAFIAEHWGTAVIVVHGTQYHVPELPGFVAQLEGEPVGLITYHLAGGDCEIVSLDSLRQRQGIGQALIDAVVEVGRRQKCGRVWLVTTNDNLPALHFYQKRGFSLVAVHRNAVETARRIKPEIPLVGNDGIPIRDELELEMAL